MDSSCADFADGLDERLQNLIVDDDTKNPIEERSISTDVPIPVQGPQTDATQGERPYVIEPLSKPVRVGYNAQNVDSSGKSTSMPAEDPMISVTLCRFEAGRLIKEVRSLSSVSFIAISHVWGDAHWRSVGGVEGDVLVADDKANFITNTLPELIGEDWFWIDILCIDQRSKAARVAVTQHIPAIYRSASKTLVVRTAGGYQECCAQEWQTVWKRSSRVEAQKEMVEHMQTHHRDDDCDEGVLTRLWPYQEVLLSNIVQFVRCECVAKTSDSETKKIHSLPVSAISDSLISTAIVWTSYGEDDGWDYSDLYYTDFIDAFFGMGTVERTNARGITQFPFAQEFQTNMANKRRTTKPRDFILAIMPQISFYEVPKNAKDMTFPALYFDCIRQLSAIGHVMAPLIIRRTINFTESITCIWESDMPEPASLGDFIKLLNGPRIGYQPRTFVPLYSAHVRSVSDVEDLRHVIGSDPEEELLNVGKALMAVHLVVRQMVLSKVLFQAGYSDLMHNVRAAPEERASGHPCFIKAVKILIDIGRLFENGVDDQEIAAHDNYIFVHCLLSQSDRNALLVLAAMIACNIGLSAFDWVQQHLQPLRIDLPHPETNASALALVSRASSVDKCFLLTEGGEFSLCMGGADMFKRWALFSAEHLENDELEMCVFPLEIRFRKYDDGHSYVPGRVGVMAGIA